MGNNQSSRKWRKEIPNAESSRVLFLLYLIHRTWNLMVEHMDTKSTRGRGSNTEPSGECVRQCDSTSLESSSCYSCCCSYCKLKELKEERQDCISELSVLDGMANCGGWSEEPVSKEKQRPPIYNPEDYAASLKKWSKKTSTGSLYDLEPGQDPNKARTLPTQNSKDFRNPCLGMGEEMSLRQFGSVSELLTKLRADLRLSFQSFVQEFSSELLDGVSLLLELLRNIQLSQTSDAVRGPPALRRRPLLDELACLQCLWSCSSRYSECTHRLVSTSSGVYALTVCIMSTVNKTRILGLQLLAAAVPHSHSAVSEALSTLRLRYGEPVRFRFLVGMLLGGGGALQAAGLALLSALLACAPGDQHRLYLQAELEQAGFDLGTLKKIVSKLPNPNEDVIREIEKYEKQLIDIDTLNDKANKAQKEKDDLRHKLELLEKRVKILQEEKGILLSLEKCLQEKCYELQEEVSTLKSEHGSSNRKKPFSVKKKNTKNREESSPPEDEGISSSERSLSPDGDPQRESMVYEVFNIKNDTYDLVRNKRTHKKMEKKSSDDEEETTIDEVIQELRNIANSDYKDQDNKQRKEDSITSTVHSIQITRDDQESEIIPSILPHPPRKARSLIHVFTPPEEGLYRKDFYSSDEDSLLSYNFNECKTKFDDLLIRDKKRTESISEKSSRQREYIDSMFYVTNEHTNMMESKKIIKNLDKMEGLNSMVDIVMSKERSINGDNDLFIPESRSRRSIHSENDPVIPESRSRRSIHSENDPVIPESRSRRSIHSENDPIIPESRSRRSIHSENDPLIPESRSRRDNFNSFIMRSPGFGNGLRDAPASITTLVSQNSDLKKNVTLGSSYGQRSKVTDMPSGLY